MQKFLSENLYPVRCEAISLGSPQRDRLASSHGVLDSVDKFNKIYT